MSNLTITYLNEFKNYPLLKEIIVTISVQHCRQFYNKNRNQAPTINEQLSNLRQLRQTYNHGHAYSKDVVTLCFSPHNFQTV
jgi:hypothetical protein